MNMVPDIISTNKSISELTFSGTVLLSPQHCHCRVFRLYSSSDRLSSTIGKSWQVVDGSVNDIKK